MSTAVGGDRVHLRDAVATLRTRWPWVLLPLIALPLVGAAVALHQPVEYEASATVLVDASAAQEAVTGRAGISPWIRSRELANEIGRADGDEVRAAVRTRLGLAAGTELPEVTLTAADDSDLLVFEATARDPQAAAEAANAWAAVYLEQKEIEIDASLRSSIADLEARVEELRVERQRIRSTLDRLEREIPRTDDAELAQLELAIEREASAIATDLELVDAQIEAITTSITRLALGLDLSAAGAPALITAAEPPTEPVDDPLVRNVALGAFVGVIAGFGLASVVETLDQRIRSSEDLQRLGLAVLGTIPPASRWARREVPVLVGEHSRPAIAIAVERIRTAVDFVAASRDLRSVVIASPEPSRAKSAVAANLAIAFSALERTVALVDVDFRRPAVHRQFDAEVVPGLTDALLGRVPFGEVGIEHPGAPPSLAVLPAGAEPPAVSSFLATPLVRGVLASIEANADLTIYDAPPVLPVADTPSLASRSGGVIVIVEARTTRADRLLVAVDAITTSGGTVLGVVLVGARGNAVRSGDDRGTGDGGRARRRDRPGTRPALELVPTGTAMPEPGGDSTATVDELAERREAGA